MKEHISNAIYLAPAQSEESAFSFQAMLGMVFSLHEVRVIGPEAVVWAHRVYAVGRECLFVETPFAVDALRRFVGARFGLWRERPTRCVVLVRQNGSKGRMVRNLPEVRDRLQRAVPDRGFELILGRWPGRDFTLAQQVCEAATFKLFCSAEGSNCIPVLYMAERGCFVQIQYDRMGGPWGRICAFVGHVHVMLRIPEMGWTVRGSFSLNLTQLDVSIPHIVEFLRT